MRAILSLILLAGLAACGMPDSDYASQGYPDARVVGATRDVYLATGTRDRLGGGLGDATLPGPAGTGSESGSAPLAGTILPPLGNAEIAELRRIEGELRRGTARYDPTTFTPAGVPVPVAVRPRTLRIWVAPWTDDAGDLIVAGYVFAGLGGRLRGARIDGSHGPNHLQSVSMIENRGTAPGSGQAGVPRSPIPVANPPPVQTRQAALRPGGSG